MTETPKRKVSELLESLPSPWKEQAIRNVTGQGRDSTMNEEYYSACSALVCSFNWSSTPEGRDYWLDLYHTLNNPIFIHNNPNL